MWLVCVILRLAVLIQYRRVTQRHTDTLSWHITRARVVILELKWLCAWQTDGQTEMHNPKTVIMIMMMMMISFHYSLPYTPTIQLVLCYQLTWDIIRSLLVLRRFLKSMSGLLLTTRSLNRWSERLMLPSAGPLAPSVFSETFGTCCLKTSGVILRRARRWLEPRPGPHASTFTRHTVTNTIDTNAARATGIVKRSLKPCKLRENRKSNMPRWQWRLTRGKDSENRVTSLATFDA